MEVFLADLIAEQHRQGIDAYALVHGDPTPHDPPWLVRVPVQCHLVYAPIAVGFRRALRQSIERLQPDVLHLHMPNNSALWVLTLAGAREIPWVVHWHADVVDSRIRWAVALAYRLYRPFEQALLQRASRIIATSPPYLEASEPLQAWRDQCSIIPLGIDLDKNKNKAPDPDRDGPATAMPLPWQEGTLRLLSIGRLTYYKGFETLIQAVAPLENVELLIVGEGELRADLAALIQTQTSARTSRIRLLGDVSDAEKTRLLQSCDLFCLASRERTEAFGIVLLEAMQYARPCLASALPGSGMAWVVQYTGAGLCVAAQDVSAWRSAIKQLHLQPHLRQRFGQAGQRGLLRDFSIAPCTRRVTLEYDLAAPEAGFHTALHPEPAPDALPAAPSAPRQGRTLIVIPARNEAASIGALLHELRAAHWHDVLVINDHSSDDTGAIAQRCGAIVLHPTLALGAWGGMQAGLRYALRHGYTSVITMDADGQHEVSEIPRLLQAASSADAADLVVGAYPERASRLRQIAWRWFQQLAGFDLRDLTSGFRLYNGAAMQVLASEEASLLDYQDLGALLLIRRAGLSIAEVPVKMNLRSVGQSRIFNSWFSVGRYMAATTLLCMARRPLRWGRTALTPSP